MNPKTILAITLILLALLITVTAATSCNETSINTTKGCQQCAEGWVRLNETQCTFSEECLAGTEYNETLGVCTVEKNATMKCISGYHAERLPNRTRTFDNTTGLATYTEYQCVPNFLTRNANTLIGVTIAIIIIASLYTLYRQRTRGKSPKNRSEDL